MEIRRLNDIAAFSTLAGRRIGFHSRNLDVAQLTEEAWQAIETSDKIPSAVESALAGEARLELETWSREEDLSTVDADLSSKIRSLMINVAQICNLKCSYCAAGGDGTFGEPVRHLEIETIYEQIRMFLHDVPAGETFSITFFGGEPLLNPEAISQLARFARLQVAGREIRLRFCVITNATLVTPDIAELLASINCHVTVSLDGPPEINDKFRVSAGGRGSTAKALVGLQHLLHVRPRLGSLSSGSVFGSHHTAVQKTYEFLKPFGFDSLKFDFAAEAGSSEAESQASREYARELAATADLAYREGGEQELRRIGHFETYFQALDSKRRLNNHCGAGKSMLSIDSKGAVTTCQWFVGRKEERIGAGNRIDHSKLQAFSDRLIDLNDCGSCWARHLCGGGCMYVNDLKNGTKHKKDPLFCQRTRATIAKAIEHYAEARYEKQTGDKCETHQEN